MGGEGRQFKKPAGADRNSLQPANGLPIVNLSQKQFSFTIPRCFAMLPNPITHPPAV
jgi:hypothetical protein